MGPFGYEFCVQKKGPQHRLPSVTKTPEEKLPQEQFYYAFSMLSVDVEHSTVEKALLMLGRQQRSSRHGVRYGVGKKGLHRCFRGGNG